MRRGALTAIGFGSLPPSSPLWANKQEQTRRVSAAPTPALQRAVATMILSSALTFAFAPPSPPVAFKYGMNQVFGVAEPGKSTETIAYLGTALTLDGCKKKCLAHPTRCWSFTYHGLSVGAPYAGECFGLTSPRWSPTPDDNEIVSGQVAWPCRDDED